MGPAEITEELQRNHQVFSNLLSGLKKEQFTWRNAPEKWCLLEIVCHLADEECEDFRARIKHVLATPELPLPSIDPVGWVTERKYMEKDYDERVTFFLRQRTESVAWLKSLQQPQWENAYKHPKFGAMSAGMFLANWLAHDYLHFRQITKLKYDYMAAKGGQPLAYAGTW